MISLACALALTLQIPPGTTQVSSDPFLDLAEYNQGTVAAVTAGPRTFVARSLGIVGPIGSLATPFVRTEAWDDQGQLLWTRDAYDGAEEAGPNTVPLARDLVHVPGPGLVVQGRTTADQLVLEALREADGQVAWSVDLSDGPLFGINTIQRLAWDAERERVLAFAVRSSVLELISVDAANGQVAWSTVIDSAAGNQLQDPQFAFSPSTQELIVASKSALSFVPISVQRVDLNQGAVTFVNDQYSASFFDLDVSPDGQRIALALGRVPSARLSMIDSQSGAVLWFFKDESTDFDDLPDVRFELDGQNLVVGYMSRGVQAAFSEPSGARFLRFDAASGQIVWDTEVAGSTTPLVGTASGPQILEFDAATHLRSYSLTQGAGQHVQRIERVANADGAVLTSLVEAGQGSGAMHLQELGPDASGSNVAILQLQEPNQPPSLGFPQFALARWDFASGTTSVTPFDALGIEGAEPIASDFEEQTRRGALVTSGAASDQFELTVVDVDSGDTLLQRSFDKPYLGANAAVRLSDDGQLVALRTFTPVFFESNSDRLWVLDQATGDLLWERELPRGSDVLGANPIDTESGQSSLEIEDGRIYVTEAVAGSSPIEARLACLEAATGAPIWSRDLGCYAVPTAVIAVSDGSVFATGDLDLGPAQAPTLLELDPADGSTRSLIPLPAGECVMAISAKEESLAAITRDTQLSAALPRRGWVFARESLALLDTQQGFYASVVPLAPDLGFAFVEPTGIDQLGLAPKFPAVSPWSVETEFGLSAKVFSIDNGESVVRAAGLLGGQSGITQGLQAWDARTGAELWGTSDFLTDPTTVEWTGSGADEFHAWTQSPDASLADGDVFSTRLETFGLPDVIVAPAELSLQAGGTARLELRGDLTVEQFEQRLYVVFGGQAPVANGPLLGSFQFPFDPADPFLAATLDPDPGTFVEFVGNLDDYGNGAAQVSIPAGLDPALAGEDFYFAFAQFELDAVTQGSTIFLDYVLTDVSGAAPLTLVP